MGLTQRGNRGGAGQGGQGQRHHPPVEHSFSGSFPIFVHDLLAKERFDLDCIFLPEKPGSLDDALFSKSNLLYSDARDKRRLCCNSSGGSCLASQAAAPLPGSRISLCFAAFAQVQFFFICKAFYDLICTLRKLRDTTLT